MKRSVKVVLALLCSSVILATCLGFGVAEIKKIHVLFGSTPTQDPVLKDNLAEFEKESGMKVEYEIVGYGVLFGKEQLELQARTSSFDVIAGIAEWVVPFAGRDLVVPLEDYAQRHGVDFSELIPSVLALGKYKGKVYYYPLAAGSRFFHYRKDLLEAAGLHVPPRDWAELRNSAKALTVDVDGDNRIDRYGFITPARKEGNWIALNWIPWLFAGGGGYILASVHNLQPDVPPENICTMYKSAREH